MNIKNLIITAGIAALLIGVSYAFAEGVPEGQNAPTPVCLAQISKLSTELKVTELSDAEQSALITSKGPPPAEGHMATLTSGEGDEALGMFIIHKDDCITFTSGRPVPLDTLNRFLGSVGG